MSNSIFTKLASIITIIFFLGNDLLASVGAFHRLEMMEIAKYTSTGNYSDAMAQPETINYPKTQAKAQASGPIDPIVLPDLFSNRAADKTAFIGAHDQDPLGSPSDDVFSIDLQDQIKNYQFAYLQYEVKGIANAEELPKAINGGEVYIGGELKASDTWQRVTVMVDYEDLINGNNQVRFALSKSSELAAEVKNVQIHLTAKPKAVNKGLKMKRQMADENDFKLLVSSENALTFKNKDLEMASIPKSIRNLTRNAWGYGLRNNANEVVKVAIGVNASKLNTPNDLKEANVFYYNTADNSWKKAHTEKVDMANLVLEASVPPNTDYFAGLIKSPDMPEASAFLPTGISDIEAANPAAGMNLISPPSQSRTGEARINYPLNIPNGRKGLQPSVALNYSSDGGTGWVGIGWNISAPAIVIDTRWGVPTFDPNQQDEVYLLNGSSLVEEGGKKGNRASIVEGVPETNSRNNGPVRFFERTMSSYKTIEREGDDPTEYVWTETMSNQTKYFYGTLDGRNVDENSVLRDPSTNNIVKWFLTRIEDQWENQIDYKYVQSTSSSQTNALENGGKRVVLDEIYYTGYQGTLGKYKIDFISVSNREDASVSMKYGFKVLDDQLLRKIDIYYMDNTPELIRRYSFNYDNDKFFKTRLVKLKEYGKNGDFFYDHDFEYYENNLTYAAPQEIEINHWNNNGVEALDGDLSFLQAPLQNLKYPSPITSSSSLGWSTTGGIGLGPTLAGTASIGGKMYTFSGTFGTSQNTSKNRVSLQDMNGDGLPDIYYDKKGGHGYYSLKLDGDQIGFDGFERISNIQMLYKNQSSTNSFGFDFSLGDPLLYFGTNWNFSKGKVATYTTDYNADGFPDLVEQRSDKSSHVRFGQMNNEGVLEFVSNSQNTPNPVIKGESLINAADDDFIKDIEMVKSWTAPVSGSINITGMAEIVGNLAGEVSVGVQKNNNFLGSGFYNVTQAIPATMNFSNVGVTKGDKFLFRIKSGDDGQQDLLTWNPDVTYVESQYFDGNEIEYTSSTYEDAFLLSANQFVTVRGDDLITVDLNRTVHQPLTDDIVTMMQVVEMDANNNVLGQWYYKNILNSGSTSFTNDIFYKISGSGPATMNFGGSTAQALPGSSTNNIYNLYLSTFSTSNVDWKEIDFRPVITITNSATCEAEQYLYPVTKFQSYNFVGKLGSKYIPNVSYNSAKVYRIIPSFSNTTSQLSNLFANLSGSTNEAKVYMTVKDGTDLLSKMVLTLNQSSGLISFETCDEIGASSVTINSSTAPGIYSLHNPDFSSGMYVEFFVDNQILGDEIADFIDSYLNQLNLEEYNSTWSSVQNFSGNFNVFYKKPSYLGENVLQWGQFAWSFEDTEPLNSPILVADLKPDFEDFANNPENAFDSENLPEEEFFTENQDELNPIDQKFFSLIAQRGEKQFMLRSYQKDCFPSLQNDNLVSPSVSNATENLDRYCFMNQHFAVYASAGMSSPGKIGETEDISSTFAGTPSPSIYNASAVVQWSKTKTFGYSVTGSWNGGNSAGISHAPGTEGYFFAKSNTQFRDYNGDGYPDKITDYDGDVKANFTNPTGGHKSLSSSVLSTDPISKSLNWNVSPVYAYNFANNDSRYSFRPQVNASFGQTRHLIQSVDLNGDGLPDHVFRVDDNNPYPFNVGLGNGSGFENQVLPILNGAEMPMSETSTASIGGGLGKLAENYDRVTKMGGSFKLGLTVNSVFSNDVRNFQDVNGDGLVDAIIMDGDEPTLYINCGTKWKEFVQSGPAIEWDKGLNGSNSNGFGLNFGFTYSFPVGSVLAVEAKMSLSAGAAANTALNATNSTLMDMNGDGVVDYVMEADLGKLSVSYAELKENNLLKTVTNPLKGSFTIKYDRIGNKNGYYPVAIKTHLNEDDKVLWDMPNSKWVMSELVVDDGYDIKTDAPEMDLDGVDEIITYFKYDGGIKSRREREFLGFSLIEAKNRPATDWIKSSSSPTTFDAGGAKFYVTQVQEFFRPIKSGFDYRKRFEYLNGLVNNSYVFYYHITEVNGELIEEIFPASINHKDYDFRNVCIDPQSTYFNEVYPVASAERAIDWDLIEETQVIFPAIISTEKATYPSVLEDLVQEKEKYMAQKFNISYDNLWNVTQYENEGKMIGRSSSVVVVESYTRYYYDYIIETDRIPLISERNGDLSNIDFDVYILSCNQNSSYSDDTVYVPTAPNSCLEFPTLFGDVIKVTSEHKLLKSELIELKETQFADIYVDKIIASMEYYNPVDANQQTGLLKVHKIYENLISPANLKRHSEVEDLESGERAPSETANYLGSSKAVTNIVYDIYGNPVSVEGPENNTSQRVLVNFTYDTEVHQFVTQVNNVSYSESNCNVYDYASGNLLKTVDANGHAMRYLYDQYHRTIGVWAPRQLYKTGVGSPTISFEYYPLGKDSTNLADFEETIPVAITNHNFEEDKSSDVNATPYNQCTIQVANTALLGKLSITNPLQTATFLDGIGRAIQVKKDVSLSNGTTNNRSRQVTGFVEFDQWGQNWKQNNSYLVVNPLNDIRELSILSQTTMVKADHDILGRQSEVDAIVGLANGTNLYDSHKKTITYGNGNVGGEPMAKTKIVWSIGTKNTAQLTFTDSRGLTTESRIKVDGGTLKQQTYFDYDVLGQLTNVTDPRNITTTYDYDNFGRMIQEIHPDRKTTDFTYDLSGNLLSKTVPDEVINSTTFTINYTYNYNRLVGKSMPESDDLYDVTYTYGGGSLNNGKGRITSISQGNSFKTDTYKYDEMGNLIYEGKSFFIPGFSVYKNYVTEYDYDSWGRVLEMVYPDGEIVDYDYNVIGDLINISSTNGSISWTQMENLLYDGFGNIEIMEYGNGTKTEFSYDPVTRNNSEIEQKIYETTSSPTLSTAYEKQISYDQGGRINKMDVFNANPNISGIIEYDYNYVYDEFNRLISTTGQIDGSAYTLTMGYDKSGGIETKDQTLLGNAGLSYSLDYDIGSADHKIINITEGTNPAESYTYNDAGSIKSIGTTENFQRSEEQLLVAVENSNGFHHYIYDHAGERIMKSTYTTSGAAVDGQGQTNTGVLDPYTVYVNPYYVTTPFLNGDDVSKHYFMGSQRIATEVNIFHDPEYIPESLSDENDDESNNENHKNYNLHSAEGADSEVSPVILNLAQTLKNFGLEEGKDFETRSLDDLTKIDDYYNFDELKSRNLGATGSENSESSNENSQESELLLRPIILRYWYHPNYLGNVEMITQEDGTIQQYFVYSPFGENMYQWDANLDFDSPYRFNGKEHDSETGNSYYGARFYNPKISVWLSVDPLADKYPNFTPYNFVANNPVLLVDPDGRKIDWAGNFFGAVRAYFNTRLTKTSRMAWRHARNQTNILYTFHFYNGVGINQSESGQISIIGGYEFSSGTVGTGPNQITRSDIVIFTGSRRAMKYASKMFHVDNFADLTSFQRMVGLNAYFARGRRAYQGSDSQLPQRVRIDRNSSRQFVTNQGGPRALDNEMKQEYLNRIITHEITHGRIRGGFMEKTIRYGIQNKNWTNETVPNNFEQRTINQQRNNFWRRNRFENDDQ